MSIVDGTGLIVWEGMLFEPGSDLLARLRWAFAQIRAEGGSIKGNEAGRPFGVYSDRYVEDASDTASGISTVNYQWGRFLRGETPSAADPANGIYASEHTTGKASDTNANPTWLREKYFIKAGLRNTIDSEPWHWAIRYDPDPDVDLTGWADLDSTPFDNAKDDSMSAQDVQDLKNFIENRGRDTQRLIQCNFRGIGVGGGGYYKTLTPEELPIAVGLYGWPVDYGDNARAFDLAVSIMTNGRSANDDEIAAASNANKVSAEEQKKRDAEIKAALDALASLSKAAAAADKS